jgi:hypothetical protein
MFTPSNGGLDFDDIMKPWPPSPAVANQVLSELIDQAVRCVMRQHHLDLQPLISISFAVNAQVSNKFACDATNALRLILSTPRPLSYIITDGVIANCNRVFHRLVQGIRLKRFVLQQYTGLSATARHFVHCYVAHLSFAVDYHWSKLSRTLSNSAGDVSFGRLVSSFRSVSASTVMDVFGDPSGDSAEYVDEILSSILNKDARRTETAVASFVKQYSSSRRPAVALFVLMLNYNSHFNPQ